VVGIASAGAGAAAATGSGLAAAGTGAATATGFAATGAGAGAKAVAATVPGGLAVVATGATGAGAIVDPGAEFSTSGPPTTTGSETACDVVCEHPAPPSAKPAMRSAPPSRDAPRIALLSASWCSARMIKALTPAR